MSGDNTIVRGWFCSSESSYTVPLPFHSIHSIVYEWLISHNLKFFSVCNYQTESNTLDETNDSSNYLIILFCLIICLCLVSILDKIKSFLKSIPNQVIDNDNQTIPNALTNNSIFQKIVNYSMVLIQERRIGLIITTIGLFVVAFFILSIKSDEEFLIVLLKNSNKVQSSGGVMPSNQLIPNTTENSTLSSSPSTASNLPESNNLLESNSLSLSNSEQITSPNTNSTVNTNVHITYKTTIDKNHQIYISLLKSSWIDMQLQSQFKVGTVTMTITQTESFLESASKAILNIALLALKFFYIYLSMIGLILLLRWLTIGSISAMSIHPMMGATPIVPQIPNTSLLMNVASP